MRLTYLTTDSVQEGVATSQVVPYVTRLADLGVSVTLHSFEPDPPREAVRLAFEQRGITWCPHDFGRRGAGGGLGRMLRAVKLARGEGVLHARSDVPAGAAVLARRRRWLWDVRSFWVDQRIAMGAVAEGSWTERVFREVERRAARAADVVVTLTSAAVDELAARHGDWIRGKTSVIPTCVDLNRFTPVDPPPSEHVRLLLSGTFNPLYDVDTALRFANRLREMRPMSLTLLRPHATRWDNDVIAVGGVVASSTFEKMPSHIAAHHAGLSICRSDNRLALVAAMPTKIGEFLASGRPVVVNRGLGDCDQLLSGGAGVVLDGTDDRALDAGCERLLELLDDPDTARRCREVATRHFNVDTASRRLFRLYEEVVAGGDRRLTDSARPARTNRENQTKAAT